ncbi:MAG: uracil-DNA glycosylase [Chloroflexota bacterium]|jgi:uracil-DNA glycosylase family 4|nr:uracil-DNA glycosylase [Chloroflexota bacterium]
MNSQQLLTIDQEFSAFNARLTACVTCPRLVEFRQEAGIVKKRKFKDWNYWSRPVPGFGDRLGRVAVVGLAPAAHGGNRTGRMFTGDSSARFLMKALHSVGFANQVMSEHRSDGLQLADLYLTAAARCAPPSDKLTRQEITNCARFLSEELSLLPNLQVVVALGRVAFDSYIRIVAEELGKRIRLNFTHGGRYAIDVGSPVLYACYHPSPRNHQTGRLSQESFADVFRQVRAEIATVNSYE